jgi:tetratricopeptide (TPR) repeat protein
MKGKVVRPPAGGRGKVRRDGRMPHRLNGFVVPIIVALIAVIVPWLLNRTPTPTELKIQEVQQRQQALRLRINHNPKIAVHHHDLAGALMEEADLRPDAKTKFRLREESAQESRIAVSLNPKDLEGYHNLGACLMHLGRSEGAEAQFKHVLSKDPNYVPSLNDMYVVLKDQGRTDEAKSYIVQAYKLEPKNGEVKRHYEEAMR